MCFEWDETKRQINIKNHGLDFSDAIEVFGNVILEFEDLRRDYGETRIRAYGLLRGVVVLVVYTPRQDTIRIISMRKATSYEQEQYFQQLY